ncbi:hypothetical protein J4731_04605 [Providencia rettgeri]|nr:hypothetical protein [Providencia rettgeri]
MLDSYIGSLLKYLHQLDSLFRDTKVISALTCVIPPVENGCDDIGKCIEPVVNWGPHAYTSVISCWQDLYISPLYSQSLRGEQPDMYSYQLRLWNLLII